MFPLFLKITRRSEEFQPGCAAVFLQTPRPRLRCAHFAFSSDKNLWLCDLWDICGCRGNIHRRSSPHTCRRCRTNRLTNTPAKGPQDQTSTRRIESVDVRQHISPVECRSGIRDPVRSSFESDRLVRGSRYNRRAAARSGVRIASSGLDRPATRPVADGPARDFVVQRICCSVAAGCFAADLADELPAAAVDSTRYPAAGGFVAADPVDSWIAVVVASRNCLAAFAGLAVDGLAVAAPFAALASLNYLVAVAVLRPADRLLAVVSAVDLVGVSLLSDLVPQVVHRASVVQRAWPVFVVCLAPSASACPVDPGLNTPGQSIRAVAVQLLRS